MRSTLVVRVRERVRARPRATQRLEHIFDHFLWSGYNSFAARADAACSLRAALRESAREHPGVRQVVLAHSHGGTVAVKALDTHDELRGGGETPDVRALLTLGTPFVRLVWQWGRETVGGRQVAMLLPPLLRVLAPVIALDLLLARSDGVTQFAAGALVIAALVAALRASTLAATTILTIVVGLGGWVLIWHSFVAAFLLLVIPGFALLVIFAAAPPSLAGRLVQWHLNLADRLWEAKTRHVENQPLWLSCPLLALRAPRDEASLVIGLAQLVQWLWHTGARFAALAMGLLERLFDARAPWPLLTLNAAFGLAGLAVWVALGGWDVMSLYPINWREIDPTLILLFYAIGIFVCFGVLLAAMVAALLVWALPAMVLSLSAGREALPLPAATQLEAEPLPDAHNRDGTRPAEMHLEILYEARLTGLNHSLYEAPEVRERIAIWLREQAGAPPVYGGWRSQSLTRLVLPTNRGT
jgi:hypothetical protein